MIKAIFERSGEDFTGFSISGHSGYSESGSDIVCASVSSAVMLTCNLATEIFKLRADVDVKDDNISMKLKSGSGDIVRGLYDHLRVLEEEYPKNISVKISEV